MDTKVTKQEIIFKEWKVSSLCFVPQSDAPISTLAVLSHGYTSHKGDLILWAGRLAEMGISSIIFDQLGHKLGSDSEVSSIEEFSNNAHKLYHAAHQKLVEVVKTEHPELDIENHKLVLGGHSLGALLALKASCLSEFDGFEKVLVGVGFGINLKHDNHILTSSLFKQTMDIRKQLMSPALDPINFFPWLHKEKRDLQTRNEKIILISGENDGIVSMEEVETLAKQLENNGNDVTLKFTRRMPHHMPELAAVHVAYLLKRVWS